MHSAMGLRQVLPVQTKRMRFKRLTPFLLLFYHKKRQYANLTGEHNSSVGLCLPKNGGYSTMEAMIGMIG